MRNCENTLMEKKKKRTKGLLLKEGWQKEGIGQAGAKGPTVLPSGRRRADEKEGALSPSLGFGGGASVRSLDLVNPLRADASTPARKIHGAKNPRPRIMWKYQKETPREKDGALEETRQPGCKPNVAQSLRRAAFDFKA